MRISSLLASKPKILYMIYGEDIITSGIIRNQVIPLLKDLSDNYEFTLLSIVRSNFSLDTVQIAKLKSELSLFRIELQLITEGLNHDETVTKITHICNNIRPNLLHCRSYFTALFAALSKQKTGIPYIFDLRGRMPEEQKLARDVARGLSLPGPADEMFIADKRMEAALLADADVSITQNIDFSNAVRNSTPTKIKRMVEIQNYVDLTRFEFDQKTRNNLRERYGWTDKPVLGFSGSMSPWCSFENIVYWASLVQRVLPTTQLVFLTYTDASAVIKKNDEFFQSLFHKYGFPSENAHFFSPSASDVPQWLCAMDVGILSLKRFFFESQHCTQPIKIGEYLGNGLPFLGNDWETVLNHLTKNEPDSGWVLPDGELTSNHLHSLISYLKLSEAEKLLKREKTAAIAQRNFSLKIVAEKYQSLYRSLFDLPDHRINNGSENSLSEKTMVLFAHYSAESAIPAYVQFALRHLCQEFTHVVLLTNHRKINPEDLASLKALGVDVHQYINEGFDFGLWHKYLCGDGLIDTSRLLLINDSVIYHKNIFREFISWAEQQSEELCGLTCNDQPEYGIPFHLQSFFLYFKSKAVSLARKFILESGIHNDMQEVIKKQEIGISQFMLHNQIQLKSMYPYKNHPNSIQLYKELSENGCGFIKKKMLCHSYTHAEKQWLTSIGYKYLLNFDYKSMLITQNLLQDGFQKGDFPE